MTLTELFTNIANAIRAKTGSTEPIIAEDFPSAIEAIPVGSTIDLDEEVTEQEQIVASQDALVGDIIAALEDKAVGGGAEFDTCTVSFEVDTTCSVYLTTIENDINSLNEYDIGKYTGLVQENIICNTLAFIIIGPGSGDITNILVDGDTSNTLYRDSEFGIIKIPNKKNETIVVSISNPL